MANNDKTVKVNPAIRALVLKEIKTRRQVDKAVKQGGLFLEGEVKESISGNRAEKKSVDTGRFRGSVNATFPEELVAKVESNLSYSKHIEYGTSKLLPRRHFRNSTARNKQKIVKFVKDSVK